MSNPVVNPSCLLEVRDLTKGYQLGTNRLSVLDGLSLDLAPTELVAIMGPSGSGKTTLLNCVSGIDVPDGGAILLSGETLDMRSERVRTRLRRHHLGMVFQFFNLIPTLTVAENVGLPLLINKDRSGTGQERVRFLLEQVRMWPRRDHFPFQLSGGEMQLTSIARSLVHNPDLLLADEPTGNVNPEIGRSIMQILRTMAAKEETGVLMVTHSPEHAAWADRICFLKQGRIVAEHRQQGRHDAVAEVHDVLLSLGI